MKVPVRATWLNVIESAARTKSMASLIFDAPQFVSQAVFDGPIVLARHRIHRFIRPTAANFKRIQVLLKQLRLSASQVVKVVASEWTVASNGLARGRFTFAIDVKPTHTAARL
jgi:hypothetical protein